MNREQRTVEDRLGADLGEIGNEGSLREGAEARCPRPQRVKHKPVGVGCESRADGFACRGEQVEPKRQERERKDDQAPEHVAAGERRCLPVGLHPVVVLPARVRPAVFPRPL